MSVRDAQFYTVSYLPNIALSLCTGSRGTPRHFKDFKIAVDVSYYHMASRLGVKQRHAIKSIHTLGITVFKIFIWGGISSDIRSEI